MVEPAKIPMTSNKKERGALAEKLVTDYLRRNKYSILETNFAGKMGEVDIICEKDGILVIVEVRSMYPGSPYNPIYSINSRKRSKIIKTALHYIRTHFGREVGTRFDVAIVTLGQPPDIQHFENAFEMT
jgi:putative endonuclease